MATTATTYTERLKLVKKAIDDLLTSGQEVIYNGRRLIMADLGELRTLEKDYETQAAIELRAANCGGRSRITYVTPQS